MGGSHYLAGKLGRRISSLDLATGKLRYTGVGNTVIRKFGDSSIRLPSTDSAVKFIVDKGTFPQDELLNQVRSLVATLVRSGHSNSSTVR